MAEILNEVNMSLFYVFLFSNIFICVNSKNEHIPVLIWTSSDFQSRKDVDSLAHNKIQSDLFEFYMQELLGDKKPTIVIFLEQVLSTDDFDWRDENGNNSFPFLTELTVTSRLDYFREVENPHRTLGELSKRGYSWTHIRLGQKFPIREGDLILLEFRSIDDHRPETLKSHDKAMEDISQDLLDSSKSWICVYTARHSNTKGSFIDKKLSSWFVDEQLAKRPTKALAMYHDEHTGFALLTRGPIELHVQYLKNKASKSLDNYLRASATSFQRKINFVIWFLNYKLTFYLHQENREWVVDEAKIMNDNGDILNLMQRHQQQQQQALNKCYVHMIEFTSGEDPMVKVKLPKYKFLKLPQQEPCVKPYGVELMATFIFFLVVIVVVFWNSVLEIYDFSAESKVSSDNILAFKFDSMNLLQPL